MKLYSRPKPRNIAIAAAVIVVLAAWGAQDYYHRYRPLSEAEVAQREKDCLAMTPQALAEVAGLQAKGRRVTEPRVFYNHKLNRCLYTYLMINPKRPESTTYNTFLIKNMETGRNLYLGEEPLTTWPKYLEAIDKLGT